MTHGQYRYSIEGLYNDVVRSITEVPEALRTPEEAQALNLTGLCILKLVDDRLNERIVSMNRTALFLNIPVSHSVRVAITDAKFLVLELIAQLERGAE